jgi:hypothetical protein
LFPRSNIKKEVMVSVKDQNQSNPQWAETLTLILKKSDSGENSVVSDMRLSLTQGSGKNSAIARSIVTVDDGFWEGLRNRRRFVVRSGGRAKGVVATPLDGNALTLG